MFCWGFLLVQQLYSWVNPDVMEKLRPYLRLAETLGNMAAQLAGGRIDELNIRLQGEISQ